MDQQNGTGFGILPEEGSSNGDKEKQIDGNHATSIADSIFGIGMDFGQSTSIGRSANGKSLKIITKAKSSSAIGVTSSHIRKACPQCGKVSGDSLGLLQYLR